MSLPASLENRQTWNRADGLLIGVIVMVSLLLFAYPFLLRQSGGNDLYCTISQKGQVVETIALSSLKGNEEQTVGGVTILLSPESVRIQASTCKGQDCVHMGEIRKAGQSIVCLPNQISVSLWSKTQDADLVLG